MCRRRQLKAIAEPTALSSAGRSGDPNAGVRPEALMSIFFWGFLDAVPQVKLF